MAGNRFTKTTISILPIIIGTGVQAIMHHCACQRETDMATVSKNRSRGFTRPDVSAYHKKPVFRYNITA